MTSNDAQPRTRVSTTLPAFVQGGGTNPTYDVVIVGSGYGGSVAAWVLAQCRDAEGKALKVLLLERGREFLPEDFPRRFSKLPGELRVARTTAGSVERDQGLFDLRLGDDVMALVANGLGGGSLINAGVMLEPDPAACADGPFFGELKALVDGPEKWYRQSRRLLAGEVKRDGNWFVNDASRWPELPPKTKALQALAAQAGRPSRLPPISVNLDGKPNLAGTAMNACNQCGDCMTGCHVGAKESLDVGLLAAAERVPDHALSIVTGATVTSLTRPEVRRDWALRVVHTDARLREREDEPTFIHARRVILAAGTLGSPEILLRTRSDKIVFSPRLGQGFSCNGDNIGAVLGLGTEADGCADEDLPADQRGVGPTITASATLAPQAGKPGKAFELQEFSVPGPLRRLFEETVTTADLIQRLPTADRSPHDDTQHDPLAVDGAAMRKALLVGVIGHDDARGALVLANPMRPLAGAQPQMGTLRIVWPQARDGVALDASHDAVGRFVAASAQAGKDGPRFVANPMWRLLPKELAELVTQPRGPVLTVHPLGGCGLGADIGGGVVDRHGGVFDGAPQASAGLPSGPWQDTLVVLDGSIVPASLGANPALTITALALRAMHHWAAAWKLSWPGSAAICKPDIEPRPGHAAKATPPCTHTPPLRASHTLVALTERLRGEVTLASATGQPRHAMVELTLAFAPTAAAAMAGPERRCVALNEKVSTLRVWDLHEWESNDLRFASEAQRCATAKWEAPLSGALRFMQRERSDHLPRVLRGLLAWLPNRGARDFVQRVQAQGLGQALSGAGGFFATASHAGEVRRFSYALTLGTPKPGNDPAWPPPAHGGYIVGSKRLTYNRRANPWRQLTTLHLDAFPGLAAGSARELKLDPRFLATQTAPLLRVESQRDHAEALAELFALGLYVARVLISVHLWSFRKPDTQPQREPQRLPGPIKGLPAPHMIDLVVDRWPADSPTPGAPVSIRLTRYLNKATKLPALVMIHGYSVSGNTFTHPTLAPSAAEHAWHAGRDVWVVELRTSSALASATYPWAMEQAGLIDIPAALLFVRQSTGRPVDVLAHCVGCAMLSMALLTDAEAVRSGRIELGVDSWLTTEHFGNLSAFNGARREGLAHPTVNRVVLSQKGPLLRYTDDNVLRAFVLQYARRWLVPDGFQFRPSTDPGVAEQLVDRLLYSLPYPDADYDTENPLWPWATTPWTATRHRMDALYGRDFRADKMSDATLRAIDDLFGPINLDTVAQTIHFARFSAITNQRGRGEFVTQDRLKQRWRGIPTFAIHGQDNGLIDVGTQQLLASQLGLAGVDLWTKTYPDAGHQDVLIGADSKTVFEDIDVFLHGGQPKGSTKASTDLLPPPKIAVAAWIGPRLFAPDAFHAQARIGAMSRPDQGTATLWLVPVRRTLDAAGQPRFTPLDDDTLPWVRGGHGDSGRWLMVSPEAALLARRRPAPAEGILGWLAVFIYASGQTVPQVVAWPWIPPQATAPRALAPSGAPQPGDVPVATATRAAVAKAEATAPPATANKPGGAPEPRFSSELGPQAAPYRHDAPDPEDVDAVRRWLSDSVSELDSAFVRLTDLQRAQGLSPDAPRSRPLRVAVASCQYPRGLFDAAPAQASLQAMAEAGDDIDIALLIGDQIYADATAGLLDPDRSDERYDLPHERALRLPAMAALMRRMPTQMLPDDHELFDNFEPLPTELHSARAEAERERRAQVRRLGMAAYHRYQRSGEAAGTWRAADFDFRCGGHAFFMLDSRTRRQRGRPAQAPTEASLVGPLAFERLEQWLTEHRDAVKFVCTPSLLLPRRKLSAEDAADALRAPNAVFSDAWCGYPGGLARLLRFMAKNQIHHTVFLSGDEHHSMHAEITLGEGPTAVKIVSVHSSALYAPFPFANGRIEDLMLSDDFTIDGVTVSVRGTQAPAGDGFAALHVTGAPAAPVLHIDYIKGHGDGASHAVPL